MKKEILEIYKSGKFYNVFGDDAIIMHYIMGYKIVSGKSGFPETAYNKVINALDDFEVSYKIYENDNLIEERNFKKINQYSNLLKKGLKTISIEKRFNNIEEKIKKLDLKEIERILSLIEDAIS